MIQIEKAASFHMAKLSREKVKCHDALFSLDSLLLHFKSGIEARACVFVAFSFFQIFSKSVKEERGRFKWVGNVFCDSSSVR